MDDLLKPNEKMLSTLAAELGLMSLVMEETLEPIADEATAKPAKGTTLT